MKATPLILWTNLVVLFLWVNHPLHAQEGVEIRYETWAKHHNFKIFQDYLVNHRIPVSQQPPAHQLFRTASDWEKCHAAEFEVPPRENWYYAAKTYQLLTLLKREGILIDYEIVSAYRNPKLNQCADGAKNSAHAITYAVDLIHKPGGVNVAALCKFWKEQGKKWNMGLSRYLSGRLHIDTTKYRTWGQDHTRKTSFCK